MDINNKFDERIQRFRALLGDKKAISAINLRSEHAGLSKAAIKKVMNDCHSFIFSGKTEIPPNVPLDARATLRDLKKIASQKGISAETKTDLEHLYDMGIGEVVDEHEGGRRRRRAKTRRGSAKKVRKTRRVRKH
jgi:hypothetical protein